MLAKHAKLWSGDIGTISETVHSIELISGARPVLQMPYRQGPKGRQVEKEEVDRILKAGVIESSYSEWASPIVLFPKPDGYLRFCVDYRRLDDLSYKDHYPIPRMDECIDSLCDARVFTTLDANSGIWQIPRAEEDRSKTAFTTHIRLFEFVRMPFGLTNAPASFQRA